MNSRLAVYAADIRNKGVKSFFSDRLKKYPFTRWLLYLFRPNFVVIEGRRLYIDKMDTVVTETLMSAGVWEPYITKLFKKYASRAKLVLDIGAHIGYFSLIGSLTVGKGGKVVAFEPSVHNFSLLEKTIQKNKLANVTAVPQGVGAKSGGGKIYLDRRNQGNHTTYASAETREVQDISITSIDDYFAGYKGKIDLVKMDIQGFEMQAVLGMKRLLEQKKVKVIISELWPAGLAASGTSWQSYTQLLAKSGFKLFIIDEEREKLSNFSTEFVSDGYARDEDFCVNILCLPR